ncbi:MAG: hypothetical protein JJE25_02880 [Bacteroidia bacterium]|nr:hypothetical protein [Bacteroidia bacterium]
MEDLLVAILVSWILFRLLRPVVFVSWNKPQRHQQNYTPPNQNQPREEEITVNKSSSGAKHIPDDAGEYVDFEEIK